MADEIRADYEQLDQVSSRFANQAQAIEGLLQKMRGAMEKLENGGWIGRGADAFFAEMHREIYPATQRLIDLLHDAGAVTREASEIMQQAEEEASMRFRARM